MERWPDNPRWYKGRGASVLVIAGLLALGACRGDSGDVGTSLDRGLDEVFALEVRAFYGLAPPPEPPSVLPPMPPMPSVPPAEVELLYSPALAGSSPEP